MRQIALMLVIALLSFGVVLGAGPEDGAGKTRETADGELSDPVLQEVVDLLDAEIEPALISEWLENTGARPAQVTAGDLIALKRAGAPETLIRRLLALASGRAGPVEKPSEAGPAEAPADAGPPAGPGVPPAAAEPGPPGLPVAFTIDYRPETDIEIEASPWDLFLYIDGRPLARAGTGVFVTRWSKKAIEFERELAPGRHLLRILQERHETRSRRKGTWDHEARVFPDPIVLDIEPGGSWSVAIEINERNPRRKAGPVSVIVSRDGITVEEIIAPSATTDTWPWLCEELETRMSEKKRASRSGQRALAGCLRWAALWPELETPTRAEVRDRLAAYSFRPASVIEP